MTSAKATLQSPVVSVKTWVCEWVFDREGSKTQLQSMLSSAIISNDLTNFHFGNKCIFNAITHAG